MINSQPNEKLHAACDECRTRKLKCSGDRPSCTRCQRETLQCVFSPQKQMGRPRKRRREADAEELAGPLENANESSDGNHGSTSVFADFDIITPPQIHEPNYVGDGIVPDLTATSQHNHLGPSEEDLGLSPISNMNFTTNPPIDPSLWDTANMTPNPTNNDINPTPSLPSTTTANDTITPCTCLSLMYLTISDLQSIPTFHFPQVMTPLRKALTVLSTLIHCPTCALDTFTAIQNTASIASLSKALIERFAKALLAIEAEASRLHAAREKKPLRIGDNALAARDWHTGTEECPMGFDVEIGAWEWRGLAKRALRAEIYGDGRNARCLLGLVGEAEDRQRRWHANAEYFCREREGLFGEMAEQRGKKCEALGAEQIRRMVGGLKWD